MWEIVEQPYYESDLGKGDLVRLEWYKDDKCLPEDLIEKKEGRLVEYIGLNSYTYEDDEGYSYDDLFSSILIEGDTWPYEVFDFYGPDERYKLYRYVDSEK